VCSSGCAGLWRWTQGLDILFIILVHGDAQRNETRKARARSDEAEASAAQAHQSVKELKRRLAEDAEAHASAVTELSLQAEEQAKKFESELAAAYARNAEARAALGGERAKLAAETKVVEELRETIADWERKAGDAALRIERVEGDLEMVSLRAVDDAHEADLRFKWLMEALHLPITGVFELLHHLKEVASGISTALEYHDSQWQALVDLKEAQRDELLLECDELQSRYDWLLTRWSAREPRQQDVRMISALQDELSRQMQITAQAVQAARQYKEALKTNDKAYTQMFGMGYIARPEHFQTSGQRETRLADAAAERAIRPRDPVGSSASDVASLSPRDAAIAPQKPSQARTDTGPVSLTPTDPVSLSLRARGGVPMRITPAPHPASLCPEECNQSRGRRGHADGLGRLHSRPATAS